MMRINRLFVLQSVYFNNLKLFLLNSIIPSFCSFESSLDRALLSTARKSASSCLENGIVKLCFLSVSYTHLIETSVVLLADGVEAAVKSMDTSDKEKIREMIDKIVSKKITEHQLDNSPLKMKDIDTIKKTFFRVLTGVYHERVQYPGQEKNN